MNMFCRAMLLAGLAAVPGSAALADDCLDEIAALYDEGGALDPFSRPPHRQTVAQYDPDGNLMRTGLNLVETPLRTIAGEVAAGHFTMAIDRDLWNGPTPEGPWTALGYQMPEGRETGIRRGMVEEQANLTDTICHGETGDGLLHYTYRTQTDPDDNGTYYGALSESFVDPATGRVMRMTQTEFIASWSEGVSAERHEITFDYDETLRVTAPD